MMCMYSIVCVFTIMLYLLVSFQEHFFLKVWEPNYSSYLAQAIRELKLFDLQYLKLSKPPLVSKILWMPML